MRSSKLTVDASLRQVWDAKANLAKELEKTRMEDVLALIHRRVARLTGKRKLNYVRHPSGVGGFADPESAGRAGFCVAEDPVEYEIKSRRKA